MHSAIPPDPETARRDRLIAWALAGLVLATVLIGALVPGSAPHRALPPSEDPACAEWGDGCTVCQRRPDGPACSLPGIACTAGEARCLRKAATP